MSSASLSATVRAETGKGAARKVRQAGNVPGVIYGHGREPLALTVNGRELTRILSSVSSSTVIDLALDGATTRTLVREIQRHPFKKQIMHVDFQELVAGEKITVDVPLRFIGVPEGVRLGGGVMEETLHALTIFVDPASIPDHIDVDVSKLQLGHSIHVRDLSLPEGVEAQHDEDQTLCVLAAPRAAVEAAAAETVEPGAAEPELIRKVKPDDEK
ncbi:MAG: rplY [Gemmatimonadetes bacterium]|nr:rplY [Gemmatimonadota bacterium]